MSNNSAIYCDKWSIFVFSFCIAFQQFANFITDKY